MVILAIFLLLALTFLVPLGPTLAKVMASGNLGNFFAYATIYDRENVFYFLVLAVFGVLFAGLVPQGNQN